MTAQERMETVSIMLGEAVKLAKEFIGKTEPDKTCVETSIAYFAGLVKSIEATSNQLGKSVRRIGERQAQRTAND